MFDGRLDFNYIENQGNFMSLLLEDLEELAKKHNLFDHKIDPKVVKKLEDLEN